MTTKATQHVMCRRQCSSIVCCCVAVCVDYMLFSLVLEASEASEWKGCLWIAKCHVSQAMFIHCVLLCYCVRSLHAVLSSSLIPVLAQLGQLEAYGDTLVASVRSVACEYLKHAATVSPCNLALQHHIEFTVLSAMPDFRMLTRRVTTKHPHDRARKRPIHCKRQLVTCNGIYT